MEAWKLPSSVWFQRASTQSDSFCASGSCPATENVKASATRRRQGRADRIGGELFMFAQLSAARFARQFLVLHRGIIDERGHDDGGLLQVVGLNAVEHVGVRVVRPRPILDGILDELKAGQADAVEGLVVGAAGVRERERLRAQIAKRITQLAEKRAQ